jgi:hypothetical protein
VVEIELEGYLETMRKKKSRVWGGPSGIVSKNLNQRYFTKRCLTLQVTNSGIQVIPPYRVFKITLVQNGR